MKTFTNIPRRRGEEERDYENETLTKQSTLLLFWSMKLAVVCTVKPVLSGHSKNKQTKGLNEKWLLNKGQKYCRMLPLEHSAIEAFCNTFDMH